MEYKISEEKLFNLIDKLMTNWFGDLKPYTLFEDKDRDGNKTNHLVFYGTKEPFRFIDNEGSPFEKNSWGRLWVYGGVDDYVEMLDDYFSTLGKVEDLLKFYFEKKFDVQIRDAKIVSRD